MPHHECPTHGATVDGNALRGKGWQVFLTQVETSTQTNRSGDLFALPPPHTGSHAPLTDCPHPAPLKRQPVAGGRPPGTLRALAPGGGVRLHCPLPKSPVVGDLGRGGGREEGAPLLTPI